MQVFEASKGQDAAAKAAVLANWEKAAVMKKEFPPYAINWQAVLRERGSSASDKRDKRGEGLHPDSPISARTLQELRKPGLE